MPGISGLHLLGTPMVVLSTAEAMEENFIKYPKETTKNSAKRDGAKLIVGDATFFKLTEDEDFSKRRRALTSSLFKKKIRQMMESIKEVTMEHIRDYRD